jgi:hypothetical protein
VPLDERPRHGEPETKTPVLPRRGRVGLTEALEQTWKELRGDALPRVGHANLGKRARPSERHLDAPARGRELDRIGQEVRDDLLETDRIPRRGVGHDGTDEGQPHHLHLCGGLGGIDGRLRHGHEVDRQRVNADTAADIRDMSSRSSITRASTRALRSMMSIALFARLGSGGGRVRSASPRPSFAQGPAPGRSSIDSPRGASQRPR